MLTLVLAEAELEIMPSELVTHPAVIGHARQRGKPPARILLDSNYHHAAMQNLAEGRRRGRPDITHLFLLTALESIANKQGKLTVIVHTRNNEEIRINPKTRIMRNYDRFLGLVEQLFEKHKVPESTDPLLTMKPKVALPQIIHEAQADAVVLLSQSGSSVALSDYFHNLKKQQKDHVLCIIGGFPSGEFHTDFSKISTEKFSLFGERLTAWTVASELLVHYEGVF